MPCDSLAKLHGRSWLQTGSRLLYTGRREALFEFKPKYFFKINLFARSYVCATYIKRNGPCSARLWSVQYPFQARFRAVLLKRSGVKRTVHGRVFLAHTVGVHNVLSKIVHTMSSSHNFRPFTFNEPSEKSP